jgi:DNA repair photolyase
MAESTKKKLPVMISPATDPYQPIEKLHKITRKCIQALTSHGFPLLIVTKSSLVTRDLDLFKRGVVAVAETITTIDDEKAKIIEPKASPPSQRLNALETLTKDGITTLARIDPIIPSFTDSETELRTLIKALARIHVKHVTVSTLKPVRGFFRSLQQRSPQLSKKLQLLYREGTWMKGYRYLPTSQRRRIIEKVEELVTSEGLTFGSCREGFKDLNTSTCDGTSYVRE